MSTILSYSSFLTTLNRKESLKLGLVVDTNILISATYDADYFFEPATQFFEYLAENSIPIYCNVNVRAEFLEIHRRIIFTESLIDLFYETDRSFYPTSVLIQLGKWAASNRKRISEGRLPLRLSESEIKKIKLELIRVSSSDGKNLWAAFCENRIRGKLKFLWENTEQLFGLNFLSTRNEDSSPLFKSSPKWFDAVQLIEKHGLSSSDAMIVNLFFCSNLDAIVSSDQEIAYVVQSEKTSNKICFVPDSLKLDMYS